MTDILEIAEKIVAEGPICDHCLGRQFAKLSTGLSNDERGRAVKLSLAMDADRKFEDAGDDTLLTELAPSSIHAQKTLAKKNKTDSGLEPAVEKCWVCLDIFKNLDFWAEKKKKKKKKNF